MTTTFLTPSQQVAIQEALINTKLLKNVSLNDEPPAHNKTQCYSYIAVTLYRFNLQKIKWSTFLKIAIKTVNSACQWLENELARCHKDYKNQPDDITIGEQKAFFSGIFSEELIFIDSLINTNEQTQSID